MNALIKKVFFISLLLLNGCAHYSQPYYPGGASYGGGYTVVQRSYYQGGPGYSYYTPGINHLHDHYRPRWQADHRRPPSPELGNHYHSDRKLKNTPQWGNPRWEHRIDRSRKENHGKPNHDQQQRFREDNWQGGKPRRNYTAPVTGRPDRGQFNGRKNENPNPRREQRRMPNRTGQQRSWNNNRQHNGNRENGRKMAAPRQDRRQRPDRGNPHEHPRQGNR